MWASYRSISIGRLTGTWTLCSNSSTKDYEEPNPGPWWSPVYPWIRCDGSNMKNGLGPAIYRPCASGLTAKACKGSVQYPFHRHQSARERNLHARCNRFRSGDIMYSIQGGKYELLLFSNAPCHCIYCRPVILWQCRGSIQVSARICSDNPVTNTNTFYGCEHSIHSEHADYQELFTQCLPSDLQLGFCRDIRKCERRYLNNHSRIQYFSYDYSDTTNYKHFSKQEQNCYMTGECHRNDCGGNCLHLFVFLNTLALKIGISYAVQHFRSLTTRENETKVEMLTTKSFCSFAFIFVGNSETYLYSLYGRTEILCLVNVTTDHWYVITVKVIHSDGKCIRPKRGRTAKQHGACVFLCFRSDGFNPALAKPS